MSGGGSTASDYGPNDDISVACYRNVNCASRGVTDAELGQITLRGKTWAELLSNPQVLGADRVDKMYEHRRTHVHRSAHKDVLEVMKGWWGPDCLDFVAARLRHDDATMDAICAKTIARVKANMETVRKRGVGIVWRTIDPGGQGPLLTGSFQPIVEPPSAWYPASNYRPTYVGVSPDFAVVLAQLRRSHLGWRSLPLDVYRLLVGKYLIVTMALSQLKNDIGNVFPM